MRSNTLEESNQVSGGARSSLTLVARAPSDWTSLSMDCEARTGYRVRLCESLLSPASSPLREVAGDRKTLLVTTPTVDRIYGEAIRAALKGSNTVSTLVLQVREETKSIELVESVCRQALSHGLNRRGLLVS